MNRNQLAFLRKRRSSLDRCVKLSLVLSLKAMLPLDSYRLIWIYIPQLARRATCFSENLRVCYRRSLVTSMIYTVTPLQ